MVSQIIDPRSVVEADFPMSGTPAERWFFLLNYALLAPSEYNTQPWRFRIQGDSLEIYADYSRRLPVVDPEDRELVVSCGAACLNLRLAARHFGFCCLMDSPSEDEPSGMLMRLYLVGKQPPTAEEERRFAAILCRQTNRSIYERRVLPKGVLEQLQTLAGREGTWLQVIQDEQRQQMITDLIVEGDRRQWADKRFRSELAQWIRPQPFERRDGLPAIVQAKGSFHDRSSPFVVRTFDLGSAEAARNRQRMAKAPVIAILGTFRDNPGDWFVAGMAIEEVLLEACASGLQTCFVNQPIEIPALRARLTEALECKDFPQLVICLGYGEPAPFTPRRAVQDVLLENIGG